MATITICSDLLDSVGISADEMWQAMFGRLTYSIDDIKVDGDKATATITVSNVDIATVAQQWQTDIQTYAQSAEAQQVLVNEGQTGLFKAIFQMLIEQYAGKFPTWLSPCQVKVLPVSEKTRDYAHQVADKLRAAGIRVRVDERDEKIGYKIREAHEVDRVPYMLILGEKEAEAGNISVRDRSNETVQRGLDEFLAQICEEIAERR